MKTTTTIETRNPITIERIETLDFIAFEIRDSEECYVIARMDSAQFYALLARDSQLWQAGQLASKLAA